MKKYIALVLALVCVLCFVGCSTNKVDKNARVFDTENIIRITFYTLPSGGEGVEVPNEYTEEITAWLGSFTIGEKADKDLVPNSNSVSVEIEYTDGTVVRNGLSTIKVDGVDYYMKHEGAPECYFEILEQHNAQTSQSETEREQQGQSESLNEASFRELLFEDERVSIYANDDKGYSVTLLYGEYAYQFEGFNLSRPYCTTWEADADDDGTKELYLIHTIGSGTGVAVDALFVFEPNGEQLNMYCHDSKEIREQFNASCSGIYDTEQQTLQLSYGESSYICDLSNFYNRDYIATATKLVLISGHIIEYSSTGDETVRLSFRLSFKSESITSLSSYLPEESDVFCLVRFNGTGFNVVEDLKFTNAPNNP